MVVGCNLDEATHCDVNHVVVQQRVHDGLAVHQVNFEEPHQLAEESCQAHRSATIPHSGDAQELRAGFVKTTNIHQFGEGVVVVAGQRHDSVEQAVHRLGGKVQSVSIIEARRDTQHGGQHTRGEDVA